MAIFGNLRKRLKHSFDNIRNERLKLNLLQALPFWVASLLTGLLAVFYAKIFATVEETSHYIYQNKAWLFVILTPVCLILARWVVIRFAPYSRGSGIPQVTAALDLATPKHNDKINKLLSIPVILVKMISSLVMVLGGAIIGREGPTIQIAGSVFRIVNNWLPKWWPKISKRNMISAGAAAGLAAAFNTPLGGIVFAVEELTKTHISYFKTALFTAVIIAGLTAQGFMGPYLYLGYPNMNNTSGGWMFAAVALVAVITGLAGSGMSKLILMLFAWKATFKKSYYHILYLIGCGLIISLLGIFVSERMLWSGKEIMTTVLFSSNKSVAWYVPLLRLGGPLLCFTTGGAGGIFAPALSAGAAVGAVLSEWLNLSASNTNLLILCGMVGLLTGVTRTPFTSAILVLEMTDRHNVIFYLMLAGMLAGIFAAIIDKHSFYDHLKAQYVRDLTKEPAIPPDTEVPVVPVPHVTAGEDGSEHVK
ncbi:MAG TPA: chloride channel protein [Chitinophagaceae bacterium]|nr:chloride channel protein [Chitinophagaceae bacterium]